MALMHQHCRDSVPCAGLGLFQRKVESGQTADFMSGFGSRAEGG